MITNAAITIYHKSYDPVTRRDIWTYTQYPAVNWYGKRAVNVDSNGLNAANAYTIRIPTTSIIEAANGDVVVKGLVQDDITGPTQLKKYITFVITAVRDNRRGSPMMHHWRIEGK